MVARPRLTPSTLTPSTVRQGSGPAPLRTDIQALRALAVSLVVLTHLWPGAIPGGYVGVDVFFVISGYLISAHLLKELRSTGRVRLGRFYARRVRRLIPAALTVLLVSTLAVWWLMPTATWGLTVREVAASALYFENWLLGFNSVDYFASTNSATVAQHYWSLSVEEQFYLVWPLLLWGAYVFARRRRPAAPRRIALVVCAVGLASLGYSIYLTAVSQSFAYFATPVRVWEFAAGTLIVVASRNILLPSLMRNLLSVGGFLAIAVTAMTFGETTAFPGATALLPVLGTVAVIISGTHAERSLRPTGHTDAVAGDAPPLWHDRLTTLRPVQLLGTISYGTYLWHWPPIVIAPFVLGHPLSLLNKVLILGGTLGAAWLSRRFIEEPAQRWRWTATSTSRTFGMMAAATTVVVAVTALQWNSYDSTVRADVARVAEAQEEPCFGPSALDPDNDCTREEMYGPPISEIPIEYTSSAPECAGQSSDLMADTTRTTTYCDFSDGDPEAVRVWLVGDSHAQQWAPAMFEMGRSRGWHLTVSYLGACPMADFESYVGYGTDTISSADEQRCKDYVRDVGDAIVEDRPSYVVTTFFARAESIDDGTGQDQLAQYSRALTSLWERWTQAGATVVVPADPPLNIGVRPVDCVALNPEDPRACARPRGEASPPDPLALAAQGAPDPRVRLADLTRYFCDDELCYAVVGTVLVYYDVNHLNRVFTLGLVPYLEPHFG